MKKYLTLAGLLVCFATMSAFTDYNGINECYLIFNNPTNLTKADIDKLGYDAKRTRELTTDNGEVQITCIDGYRIIYLNDKKVPFMNIKVELSATGEYEKDKQKIINNIKYLTSHSEGMETNVPIELNVNGYKIYGLNRTSMDKGMLLGSYVMFPGNDITVYFYFNNLKPEYRHVNSIEEFKTQRDKFMSEYTAHLKTCK